MSFMSKLREEQAPAAPTVPYGWYEENGEPAGFAYGGQMFCANGSSTRKADCDDAMLAKIYAPRGELNPWLRAARLITDQERPELDAVFATAFAAPLLSLIGATGICVPVTGPTGCGKTTGLEVAASVWGNPRLALDVRATGQGSMTKIARLRHLPVYWDETHTPVARDIIWDLMLALSHSTSGAKHGVRHHISEVRNNQTIIAAAATNSFWNWVVHKRAIRKDTNEGGLYRLFEITLGRVLLSSNGQLPISQAQAIKATMTSNHGVIGREYARLLGRNPARAKADALAAMEWFEIRLQPTRHERYWISTAAVLAAGATFANELGCAFDLERLRNYLLHHVETLRERVKGLPVNGASPGASAEILHAFLDEMRSRSLWTQKMVPLARQGNPRAQLGIVRSPPLGNPVYVHYALKDRLIMICQQTFRTYMEDHKVENHQLIKTGLKTNFGATTAHMKTLAKSTEFATKKNQLMVLPVPTGSQFERHLFAASQQAEQVA